MPCPYSHFEECDMPFVSYAIAFSIYSECDRTCPNLANVLNTIDLPEGIKQWVGGPLGIPGATDSELFETLNNTGSWAAVLWEVGAGIGQMVLVDGLDEAGYVLIRDPWDGTRYRMTREDFLKYWTTQAVFRS